MTGPMRTWNEVREELLRDNAEVQTEYQRLGPLYAIIGDVLSLRYELGLSQAQLAARMGKQQPAIARFEAGNAENPTLGFIQQLADALGAELTIRLTPKQKTADASIQRRVAEEQTSYSPS